MPEGDRQGDKPGFLQRMDDPTARDRAFRMLSIVLILVLVGACVVVVLAVVLELAVAVVALAGLMAMGVTFYLFVRLWPEQVEAPSQVGETVAKALEEEPPPPLSPEEYRRQREQAQKMIREKAAPALAKAIRGILRQDEMNNKGRRRGGGRRQ